jgi:nondiscriminating aspartyl-tRNA synthetase
MFVDIAPLPAPLAPGLDVDGDWSGRVHQVRRLAQRAFVKLWLPAGLLQVVVEGELPDTVRTGASVRVRGRVRAASLRDETLAWRDRELGAAEIEVLSTPSAAPPFDLTRPELLATAEHRLDHRPVSLRHPRIRAVFAIQAALVRGFRQHLDGLGFTAIHTPKLGAQGAEGGANLFELSYFGRRAVLAQSPQLYKEMCVAVFGRVYEIGPVFRAEPHATRRHLNEYVSLDVELGPIASMAEVMALEVGLLRAMFDEVRARCAGELALLGATLPAADRVVAVRFAEVKAWTGDDQPDLSPAEERAVCERAHRETGAELVFVTGFPSSKRPFYTLDHADDPKITESFDLLLRGTEITSGGQRIHDAEMLRSKLRARGMDPADFEFFLEAHDCGLPPHGGFGLGLERLTALLCGLDNVRDAALFPRDAHRLTP